MSNEIETTVNANMDSSKKWQQPRLESILFCDSYSITEDGKTNLLGIFDRIYVDPEIKQTPPFKIFTRTAETKQDSIQIIGYAPNGAISTVVAFGRIPASEFTPNLPANLHSIANMGPFHVPMEGVYWFDVSFKGQSVGGAALVIEFRETEDKAGGTDTYI
ncbi:MAG: hypothetical protein H0T60_18475 [Acidobacteria bacterium]|nr:hypothetical protein [Acidobacteriota bacterium]